jgi:negative regulator of flagellin synthesis FlgM
MSRISAYGSPTVGATRKGGSTEKTVGATAAASSTDNTVRNAPSVSSFLQTASASAPIDEGRVAAIRDALANGSYVIDAEKLAAKMMELDLGVVAN